jgi:hypothetical protein
MSEGYVRWYAVGLHVLAAAVHASLFAVGRRLTSDLTTFTIVRYHSTTPFDPEKVNATALYTINLISLLTWPELITAQFEVAYALLTLGLGAPFGRWTYNPVRWIEYSITATALSIALAVGAGIIGFEALLLLALSGGLLQFTGFVAERSTVSSLAGSALLAGSLILATQVFAIVEANANRVHDWSIGTEESDVDPDLRDRLEACWAVPSPTTTYLWKTNLAVFAVFYSTFGIHAMLSVLARTHFAPHLLQPWSDFRFVDIVYTLLSISSKTVLFVFILTTFKTFEEHHAPCVHRITVTETFSVEGWQHLRTAVLVTVSALAVALAVGAQLLIRYETKWTPARKYARCA